MKKEDYMKLSKERLAELLEERDNESKYPFYPLSPIPTVPNQGTCPYGGNCTNPYRDCIGCPGPTTGGTFTTTDKTTEK